ncbi:MAG: hypothetical protein GXP00_12005, partial [Alphaproteobacteria bacterium]|nr:hypothetical protein [Alphaproteobacteria bacterium]
EDVPAIKLLKKADSILLEVTVTNDSRKESMRAEEIYKTLKNMIKAAGKYENIVIGYGDGVFNKLNLKNYKSIILSKDKKKNDTTNTTIFVKTSLKGQNNNSRVLIQDIKKFIKDVSVSGRTELIRGDEPILTIINPEKYRYELIDKIATDAKKVKNSFGKSYEVIVQGLQQPLIWERASIDEMHLFIIYRYQIVPPHSPVTSSWRQ